MEDVRVRKVQVAFVEYIMLPAPSWHSSPGNLIPHYIPSASKQPLRLFSVFLSFQNKDCLAPVFDPFQSFSLWRGSTFCWLLASLHSFMATQPERSNDSQMVLAQP